jgi:hypothetical protein
MRPVKKGAAPKKTYARYQDAIGDLENVLGDYCSYCEQSTALEVEHVSPKSLGGALTDWDNFLLACKACNVAKGKTAASVATSLWPDTDNTFLAISYSSGGFISVAPNLPAGVPALAAELIRVLKLDKHDGTPGKKPTKRDKRSKKRADMWSIVEAAKTDYLIVVGSHPQEALSAVVRAASGYGFFSVWMTIFHDVSAVCQALVAAFKGTAQDCYMNGAAVNRPGARI